MKSYKLTDPWTNSRGETVYSVKEESDGYIGRVKGVGTHWEWTTDLRMPRKVSQLTGKADSREAAAAAFKAAYEPWRRRFTDEHFKRVYRRNWD